MQATRDVKIALLASASFLLLLITLNNAVFDYSSNYRFVQHVLSMDTLFSGESQRWRAFVAPEGQEGTYWVYRVFYWTIILWEAASAALCACGAWRLLQARVSTSASFHAAKSVGVYALGVTLLLWFTAFLAVGGEWFLMWQSSKWNGQAPASRLFACFGIMLVFLVLPDGEVSGTDRPSEPKSTPSRLRGRSRSRQVEGRATT